MADDAQRCQRCYNVPMRSYYDEAGHPICAQGVVGGFQARVLQEDKIAPVWLGEAIHEDPEDALAEARARAAEL